MANFKTAFDHTLGHEGGYVNDKDDPGGETYKGISRVHWADWEGWNIIDAVFMATAADPENFSNLLDNNIELTAHVQAFYKTEFWNKFHGDEINDDRIAGELFDTAVNQSIIRASKYFQLALNYANRNGKLFPDIVVDGFIGNGTLGAFNKLKTKDDFNFIYITMNVLQAHYYLTRMDKNPVMEKYARGWFNRVTITKEK